MLAVVLILVLVMDVIGLTLMISGMRKDEGEKVMAGVLLFVAGFALINVM